MKAEFGNHHNKPLTQNMVLTKGVKLMHFNKHMKYKLKTI